MKAASLSEIQKELITLPPKRIAELCVRLAKHKKENKELLTYLLFEAGDEEAYIQSIKDEMQLLFLNMNQGNLYWAKKDVEKNFKVDK